MGPFLLSSDEPLRFTLLRNISLRRKKHLRMEKARWGLWLFAAALHVASQHEPSPQEVPLRMEKAR